MSGVKKIISGIVNPQEYLQKIYQEEAAQSRGAESGFGSGAQNIGEQLSGNNKQVDINNQTANPQIAQQNNLPDNPANRVINQNGTLASINENDVSKQTDIGKNVVQNIEKQNAVIQNNTNVSKLDQILSEESPIQTTNIVTNQNNAQPNVQMQNAQQQNIQPQNVQTQAVPQNVQRQDAVPQNTPIQNAQSQNVQVQNNILQNAHLQQVPVQNAQNINPQQPQVNIASAEIANSTIQNIVNNEKMSQAVSYQINNNDIKNTTKDFTQSSSIVSSAQNSAVNKLNPLPTQNETQIVKPELQNSKTNVGNVVPNITPNQPQASKVNNISQTMYNRQYQAIVNDADKNSNTKIVENPQNMQENKPNENLNKTQKSFPELQRTDISAKRQIVNNDKIQNSIQRSIQVKEMLGLPKTLGEILFAAQNKNSPINTNTLMLNNLNQNILQNQKVLSQIFDETGEIQPIVNSAMNNVPVLPNVVPAAPQDDAITLIFSGMVRMPDISALILKNSKDVVTQLTAELANSSKSTASRIKDTLNVINSCIAMADSGNPAQTLKSLMLLYLPWLPLNDGIGFDLEVDTPDGEIESNASKLTVLIQTRNFGNVKGVFTLTTTNSVDAYIICNDGFPKKTLLTRLNKESEAHSMSTNIDIESVAPIRTEENNTQEAKVNLSATNEMNPYLLLMAHSFIRNTITIDTEAEFAMAANSTT